MTEQMVVAPMVCAMRELFPFYSVQEVAEVVGRMLSAETSEGASQVLIAEQEKHQSFVEWVAYMEDALYNEKIGLEPEF